jgi:pilus assembly protein CpaB
VLIMVLAVLVGGSAVVGVNSMRQPAPAAPAPETVPIVVAADNVPRGTQLTADLLKTRDWPKDLLPPGAFTSVEEALDRVPVTPLMKEEVLLETKLAPKGAGRGLAALIPSGMRAVTIQATNVATGVAGLALPGNRVDVLLTVNGNGGDDPTGGGSTTTLLQNVEILAVDQRVDAPSENKVDAKELRSVTLLVTPNQAAKLDLGQNKGTLHLALRNLNDNEAGYAEPTTVADLRLYQEKPRLEAPRSVSPPAPPPEPERPVQIRTLRGSHEGAILVMPSAPTAAGGR